MAEGAGVKIRASERVMARDRTWVVKSVSEIVDDRALITLDPEEPGQRPLTVVIPPEKLVALPPVELTFDVRGLGPFGPWRDAHKLISVTSIKDVGILSGARFGRVALEAYQVTPVLRILSKPSARLLICDDVGLGKTVEAGLCMLELMARKRAARTLIVVPSGLLQQWRDEFAEKFGVDLVMIENAAGYARAQTQLPAGVNPWDVLPRVLTSIDYLKKVEVRERALRSTWDLVVVDEAHYLAESGTPRNPYRTQRTKLGADLRDRSRALLLLTATPHNGYPHTFRSLVELVEPTCATLEGDETRVAERLDRARIRRMKSQIKRKDDNGRWVDAFIPRNVEGIPVPLETEDERKLIQLVSSYCSRTARTAQGEEDENLVAFAMQIIKKRMVSSRNALRITLENRLAALSKEEQREEKPEKSELRDYQAQLPMSENVAERIAQRIVKSAMPPDEKRRKEEVKKLSAIRKLLRKLPEGDPKIDALIGYLSEVFDEDLEDRVIIFTEYLDTLSAIKERLDSDPLLKERYVILRGGLSLKKRLKVEARFEEPQIRVMLATDAASEGLNLQRRCHRVVHFELPWNPNRLEQRNGRVDRYGQSEKPEIRYLYYPDSPEDDIMARLVEKIEAMQGSRISTPDLLGVMWGAEEILDGLTGVDPEAPDLEVRKGALVKTFEDRTDDFVESARVLLASVENISDAINEAEEMLNAAEPLLRDDGELETLLRSVLGASMSPDGQEGVYRINVPLACRGAGVDATYKRATVRRSIATRTKPEEVEFITPLHPLVRALETEARRTLLSVYPDSEGLPPKRLAARRVPSGEKPGVVFTFLAALTGDTGTIEEALLPIRVDIDGTVHNDLPSTMRIVYGEGDVGEVHTPTLSGLLSDRFDDLYARAKEAAGEYAAKLADAARARRSKIGQVLRDDLDSFKHDRLKEIDEEYRYIRSLVEESGQLILEIDAPRGKKEHQAKVAAVDTFVKKREEEIESFEMVSNPAEPRPLGALFLVPEGL